MRPHVDNRARCPASFFRRQPPRRRGRGWLDPGQLRNLSPEDRGYHDGYHDRHGPVTVNYYRSQDWLAWLRGWRVGQEELRQAEITEFGATLRLPPPENRQQTSTVGGAHAA